MTAVDDIKQRLDIVEVIGGYVPLKKSGHNWKGLCPFHSEKTPSFVVFPDSQTWRCFGACSFGGDIFTFLMRRENMEFVEALRALAERAGVQLEAVTDIQRESREQLDRLRAINAASADYFHHILVTSAAGEAARAYLERRGTTRDALNAFQVGFAPDGWHGLQEHLARQRYAQDDMLEAGVLSKNDAGNVFDRFRGRIMFPVRDAQGDVIGFGARALGDEQPKYLNTPDTPLFDKGRALYGIDLARKAIRDLNTAIIVEGYMDVVILHQCGVANVVACMGTALTEAHVEALKRVAHTFILALDPDAAGLRAVGRGAEMARDNLPRRVVPIPSATGLIRYEERLDAEIRVLLLPDGLDPDELILQDRARWDVLAREAPPVAEFLFHQVLEGADLATAKGKREAVRQMLPILQTIENAVERTHYVQRLAQAVHMDERELAAELRSPARRPRASARAGVAVGEEATAPDSPLVTATADPGLALEEHCLALLIASPGLVSTAADEGHLAADSFSDVRHQRIYAALAALTDEQATTATAVLQVSLDTESWARVESLRRPGGPAFSLLLAREDLVKSAARLREHHLSRLISELRYLQQDEQDQGGGERLREISAMIERLTRESLQVDQQYHAATMAGRRQFKEQTTTAHVHKATPHR